MKRRGRPRIDVDALLAELGVEAHRSGNERRGYCPDPKHRAVAGSSAATKQGAGTWQIRTTGDKAGLHHCYSCGFGGGPVDLVAAVLGIGRKEARKRLGDLTGNRCLYDGARSEFDRKVEDRPALRYPRGTRALWRDVPQELHAAVRYLERRGFTQADVARYRVGGVPEHERKYAGRVIVPVVVGGVMVDFVARLFIDRPDHVAKALSGRKVDGAMKEWALWGYDDLDPDLDVVHVVEGIWDAHHLLKGGVPNVVAACGSAWSEERTRLLAGWRRVVMIPDGDPAGEKWVKLASSLRFDHEVLVTRIPEGRQPEDFEVDRIKEMIAASNPPNYSTKLKVAVRPWTGKVGAG